MSQSIVQDRVQRRHSAEVKMHLRVGEQVISIAQMGPDFLILRSAVEFPPCCGRIWLSIDGREREWDVRLPKGKTAEAHRVEIANV
jgi:hypothetical protein